MRTEKLRKDIIDKRQFSEKPPFILKISVKFEKKNKHKVQIKLCQLSIKLWFKHM